MNSRIKQLFGIATFTLVVAAAGHAQTGGGTVSFVNSSSTKLINSLTGNPVTAADNVVAALYWAPVGSNTFVQLGAPMAVGIPLPGLYAGGTRTTGAATPGGSTGQFRVRAWSGGFASVRGSAGDARRSRWRIICGAGDNRQPGR